MVKNVLVQQLHRTSQLKQRIKECNSVSKDILEEILKKINRIEELFNKLLDGIRDEEKQSDHIEGEENLITVVHSLGNRFQEWEDILDGKDEDEWGLFTDWDQRNEN